MATIIQLRRDTAANWTSVNPTLAEGEEGLETDTGLRKVGDGVTAWASLAYNGAGVTDGDKGDITVSGSGATWTIDPGTVTLAKQADVATGTVFYRKTAGTGSPEVQTLATLKTDLAYTASDVGLGSVTNDAQTKAAIVPNTAPSAGQILAGNAGGTAYAPVSMSGGATMDETGAVTLAVSTSDVTSAIATDPAAVRDALKLGPKYCFEALCDFATGSTNASTEWYTSNSGSGASVVPISAQGNRAGYSSFNLGTTSTGKIAVLNSGNAMRLGLGAAYYRGRLDLAALSDGTNTFTVWVGWGGTTNPSYGVFFRYTDSENSGKWQAVGRRGGVETSVDTGVTAVAGTDRLFEIRVAADASSATFYIDGTLVATLSTNLPDSTHGYLNAGLYAGRSAGTSALTAFNADYMYVRIDWDTTR